MTLPTDPTLFNAMAEAVINELNADERAMLNESTFARIIKACYNAAATIAPVPAAEPAEIVQYPRMHFTRAATVRRGDHVWMTDCWFNAVSDTQDAGNKLHVYFADGETITIRKAGYVKVAVSADEARRWNHQWGRLDETLREHIRETHGLKSVAL